MIFNGGLRAGASFIYLKNPIHFMLDKRSLLAFQQHTGLGTLKTMPDILGNVNAISAFFVTQDTRLDDLTLVIVNQHFHLALQNHKGLVLGGMMMNRNLGAGFQGIEKAMAFVFKALMEIVVLPEPGRLFRLLGQIIHQLIVYNLHKRRHN